MVTWSHDRVVLIYSRRRNFGGSVFRYVLWLNDTSWYDPTAKVKWLEEVNRKCLYRKRR